MSNLIDTTELEARLAEKVSSQEFESAMGGITESFTSVSTDLKKIQADITALQEQKPPVQEPTEPIPPGEEPTPPTEPVEPEPTPVEPEPVEPEPVPVEPEPVEPEPTPVEPEPTPIEPEPVDPTPTDPVEEPTEPTPEPPVLQSGWTDIVDKYLVESDGSFSLGTPLSSVNDTRDKGSKIVFFDVDTADNTTGEAYWFHKGNIVNSKGSPTNAEGLAYGTNPLQPNLDAIKPFKVLAIRDPHMRTVKQDNNVGLSDKYPDWYLYRRGQTHTEFGEDFHGGRSESEPMVVAAYGDVTEKRPIIDPSLKNPFSRHNYGQPQSWMHMVVKSLELKQQVSYLGFDKADSYGGGPVTAYWEDIFFHNTIVYPVAKSKFHRCASAHSSSDGGGHKQAYYSAGFKGDITFSEMIFYKGGHKTLSRINVDPKRDIYSRNVYQGGGAKMGHKYLNMISMDGGSGGPQMRLGGHMENSLVVEGYMFSSTSSNSLKNEWMETEGQVGSSAKVKDSVMLVLKYPNAADPDDQGLSDVRAQPGNGYTLQGASFGTEISGNIISGAMLMDELKETRGPNFGIGLKANPLLFANGTTYSQQRNVFNNNIVYRTHDGMKLEGDATGAENLVVRDNIIVSADEGFDNNIKNVTSKDQLHVFNNEIYAQTTGLTGATFANDNKLSTYDAGLKRFTDPNRTVKRYVTEVLGVTLLEWGDDPYLDPVQRDEAEAKGNAYDPAGLKTFALMATQMRLGGGDVIPKGQKPSFDGDYAWDDRLTAKAVVNWIREGFDKPPVD